MEKKGNNKNPHISYILIKYDDFADVTELFGVKRIGRYAIRAIVEKIITVK